MKRLAELLKITAKEFSADHGDHLAASIAFNLFFSLFPLAFAAVYITGAIPELQGVQQHIVNGIGYLLPGFGQLITGITSNVQIVRNGFGALIILGAVWGGISFFNAVILSLNVAWGNHKPLPILKTQLIYFLLLLAAGILVFLSVVLTITLNGGGDIGIQSPISQFIGENPALTIASNILVMAFAFLLFILFYKYVPTARPRWRDIWLGALIAAVFFEAAKFVFIFYLGVFNPFDLMDRSVSTAIAFMMWTYLSASVFLFVAKMTFVRLRNRGARA
jgi:membrane protein